MRSDNVHPAQVVPHHVALERTPDCRDKVYVSAQALFATSRPEMLSNARGLSSHGSSLSTCPEIGLLVEPSWESHLRDCGSPASTPTSVSLSSRTSRSLCPTRRPRVHLANLRHPVLSPSSLHLTSLGSLATGPPSLSARRACRKPSERVKPLNLEVETQQTKTSTYQTSVFRMIDSILVPQLVISFFNRSLHK